MVEGEPREPLSRASSAPLVLLLALAGKLFAVPSAQSSLGRDEALAVHSLGFTASTSHVPSLICSRGPFPASAFQTLPTLHWEILPVLSTCAVRWQ